MEAKHTPGPWKFRKAGGMIMGDSKTDWPAHVVYQYRDEQGRHCTAFVAVCESTTLPNEANALLIAAAPELLTALKELAHQVQISNAIDDHGHALKNLKALHDAEAAIRKAKGEM
jgi:hypothetical protein